MPHYRICSSPRNALLADIPGRDRAQLATLLRAMLLSVADEQQQPSA